MSARTRKPGYAGELPDFEMIATNCKACMARNGHAHDHTDEVHNVVKLIAAGLFLKDKPLLTLRPSDSRPVLNPEYQGWRASITFALALRVLAYCEDYDELTKATTASR